MEEAISSTIKDFAYSETLKLEITANNHFT
jgi:hypothetical protein